ncbi:hypothetical protein [Vibrio parahaemolyticus]|uniref:hypothetical protein n=1 Tax=Vibrio parahaemolyticus TaxID=670 RepID=UPI00040EF1D3|nr:hypothetical protein [Vibrio parahaemolyticus]HCE5184924.1 hypothetical protein [Vibrio parahaemolyticus]
MSNVSEFAAILMSIKGHYLTTHSGAVRFIPLGYHSGLESATNYACQFLDATEIYGGVLKAKKSRRYWVTHRDDVDKVKNELADVSEA